MLGPTAPCPLPTVGLDKSVARCFYYGCLGYYWVMMERAGFRLISLSELNTATGLKGS